MVIKTEPTDSIRLHIYYFASLREKLGCTQEDLTLPISVSTIGALRDWLATTGGRGALAEISNLRCALNQDLTDFSASLHHGDEVAFFPPVTGG